MIKEWAFVIFLLVMPVLIGKILDIPEQDIKQFYKFCLFFGMGYLFKGEFSPYKIFNDLFTKPLIEKTKDSNGFVVFLQLTLMLSFFIFVLYIGHLIFKYLFL